MEQRVKDLTRRGDHLFSKRGSVTSLWQQIADHFYPQRGTFTVDRHVGDEFADHLVSSYPVLVARDLGNQFASMLRRDEWFQLSIGGSDRQVDHRGKAWLDYATTIQRKAMYGRRTNFVRSTKEGDMDFSVFGQAVISCQYSQETQGVVYQCWHLRDVAWAEDGFGQVNEVHRKWKPTARQLKQLFKEVSPEVEKMLTDSPHQEVNVRHMVLPAAEYGGDGDKGFVSVFADIDNDFVLEEVTLPHRVYCIPRWQTVSGSQYAHSPATIVGLPDARLIQDMNRILLDAGERAVDPPVIATQEAVRGDVALYAGGITWVDNAYDERLGTALRPMSTDKSAIPLGLDMELSVREMLAECFYLNKLTLPPLQDATAYEVRQRVEEYVRQALPIFEPMESEYNLALCELTFEILMRANHFGPTDDIPTSLRGVEVEFEFESPIRSAVERNKVGRFQEVAELLAIAAQVDPGAAAEVDIAKSMRDAVEGTGAVEWLVDEKQAQQKRGEMQAMQAMAQ